MASKAVLHTLFVLFLFSFHLYNLYAPGVAVSIWELEDGRLAALPLYMAAWRMPATISPKPSTLQPKKTSRSAEGIAFHRHILTRLDPDKSVFGIAQDGVPQYNCSSYTANTNSHFLFLRHFSIRLAGYAENKIPRMGHKPNSPLLMALWVQFCFFSITSAAPLLPTKLHDDTPGFETYWENQYRQFTSQYSGPLLMTIVWASLLSITFVIVIYYDHGRWNGTNLLLITMTIISVGSFFIGMSEWLSGWQLSMLFLFNAGFNVKFIQQKLFGFPRSKGLTAFLIGTISLVSAGTLAYSITAPGGRYENPWILAAMLVSPATIFYSVAWLILLRNTGVATCFEEGLNFWCSLLYREDERLHTEGVLEGFASDFDLLPLF